MTPTRRQVLQASGGCAAAGLVGCSGNGDGAATPTGPITLKASDVPVGGGVVLPAGPYVVTQPTAGEFKAFSGICTHSGCKITKVPTDGIFCACHGSVFTITDGAVVRGPATKPLPAVAVKESNGTLTIG